MSDAPPTGSPVSSGDHARLAVAVADAAFDAMVTYTATYGFLRRCATREVRPDPDDVLPPEADLIDVYREGAKKDADEIGHVFEAVSSWWLADRPPEFSPTHTSALEAIVTAMARLAVALDDRCVPGSTRVVSRWAVTHLQSIEFQTSISWVQCEAAAMARHAPVSTTFRNKDYKFEPILGQAWEWATSRLEAEWHRMSDAERWQSLDAWGATKIESIPLQPPASRRPDSPRWSFGTGTLMHRGRVVRAYSGKKASHRQWEILNAFEDAGWPDKVSVARVGLLGKTLNDTLNSLNEGLTPGTLRFRAAGGGGWVSWAVVQEIEQTVRNR